MVSSLRCAAAQAPVEPRGAGSPAVGSVSRHAPPEISPTRLPPPQNPNLLTLLSFPTPNQSRQTLFPPGSRNPSDTPPCRLRMEGSRDVQRRGGDWDRA